MAFLGKIFNRLRVLYYPVIFCGLFFILGGLKGYSEEVPNPFKELFNWVYQQNIGLTYFYDIDQKDSLIGARWQFIKSKHEWLSSGLFASEKPSLGVYFGFNLGKLIEKIKGQPLVYLKHLEVGYAITWDLDSQSNRRDGVYLNVIKIEF